MSNFNRVERPEDRTRPRAGDGKGNAVDPAVTAPDRYAQFKATTAAHIEYRDAYWRAEQAGVAGLAALPHPDTGGNFDPAEALARLADLQRGAGTRDRLEAVPGVNLET